MASFKPFDMQGIPMEEQFQSYNEAVKEPFDKNKVDAYTRTRVILMNGIENNGMMTKHMIDRMSDNNELKKELALVRRVESLQQQMVNWLIPANETVLETTLGYEQVAVDLTANLAKNEEQPYFKSVLDFALIEDFDHLYRYANLAQVIGEGDPERIVQGKTEIKEGRPTRRHHRHPYDEMRKHYDNQDVSPKTKMNYFTIVSAEQQTMLFYKGHGMMYDNDLAKRLYFEIADVEQQHVSQYEMVGDPKATPLEMNFLMEVNEAYNYYSCAQTEPDPRFKSFWENMCKMEITHVKMAGDMLQKYEGKDPMKVLGGDTISPLIVFEPNKDYVNQIVEQQKDWGAYNMEFQPEAQMPKDWPTFSFRDIVNAGGAPSDRVIEQAQGGKQRMTVSPTTR